MDTTNYGEMLFYTGSDGSRAVKNGKIVTNPMKQSFSFDCDMCQLHENLGVVTVNGVTSEMTKVQFDEVRAYYESITVDVELSEAVAKLQHANKFLSDTDWIEAKFVRDVLRDKTATEDEFNTKYAELLENRKKAIAVVGEMQAKLSA
jgi:hypothetical protein